MPVIAGLGVVIVPGPAVMAQVKLLVLVKSMAVASNVKLAPGQMFSVDAGSTVGVLGSGQTC